MKKRLVASSLDSAKGPVHSAALESKVFGAMLNILKHLAITRFDDGTPRIPGTIIWRPDGSSWKLIAKEPSSALQLTVSAPMVDDAFALLDILLGAEEAPWEHDPNAWVPPVKRKK